MRILPLIVALGLWSPALAAQAAPAEPDGAALYRQHCRSCHGAKGTPPARMVAVYSALKPFGDMPADSIAAVVRRGKGKDMKAFADRLSAAEIQAVAAYIRTFGDAPAGP
jgi:mono/diheme cytochrome c family protein